jgi:hypothetical protein
VVGETPMQRRSFPTSGLRQPLLIGRRTFTAKRVLADAQTHVPKSGGRQPAVVGETPMQRRSFPTAGLRQPLLIGQRTFTAKRVLADAQTHVPRSGGRHPAVVCDTDAVPGKSNIAQRLTNTQPGAAGVSPPWCATPTPCRENRTSHSG